MNNMSVFPRFASLLIAAVYFFSGLTALAYEVLWAKMLALIFGASIFGVVITVSAFMAGLGCGSSFGFYLRKRLHNPIIYFAAIEISIGIFAFNLPSLFQFLDTELIKVATDFSFNGWFSLQAVVLFLFLFLPAFAMGFGFPIVLHVLNLSQISLATIYAVNTLGGVLGALLPLVLLPTFGWTVSVRLIAVFSIIIGIAALLVGFLRRVPTEVDNTQAVGLIHWPSVFAYAVIGAAALMLQIAWTRLYGMLMLRTEYVMAIILASFLIGIGFGSYLAKWLMQRYWLIVLPVTAALFSVFTLWSLPWLAIWAETVQFQSLTDALLSQAGMLLIATLPVTLAFGAWLPLITHRFGDGYAHGAIYYASNSIGAALGALVAGIIITPMFGSIAVIVIAVIMILGGSLVWVRERSYLAFAVVVLLLMIPVSSMPPVNKLLPISQAKTSDLAYYEDALTIAHVVEDEAGNRLLLADLHRMDASSEPTAVAVQKNQARLPLLLAQKPQSVLFLGLGTGITAAGSLPLENLSRTAVELSGGAIQAASGAFSAINQDITQHLSLVRDDARRFLKVNQQQFDVIVGDLFHPDLIGRSALLSAQQFQRAKEHLTKDGLFVQWLALNQFDLHSLKVILRTFKQVFPDAVVFMDGFRLALVGSAAEVVTAANLMNKLKGMDESKVAALTGSEGAWTWLGRFFGPIPDSEVPIQDEWAPVIEFSLPFARYQNQVKLSEVSLYLLRNRPSIEEAARALQVRIENYPQFESAYIATSLIFSSWLAGFSGDTTQAQKFLKMAYASNPDDRWIGFSLADQLFAGIDMAVSQGLDRREALQQVLAVRPDHLESLKMLWRLEQAAGNRSEMEQYAIQIRRLNPLDKEVGAVQ